MKWANPRINHENLIDKLSSVLSNMWNCVFQTLYCIDFLLAYIQEKWSSQLSLYWFFFALYFYLTGAIFLEVLWVTLLLKITRHNTSCDVSLMHLVALCFTNVQVVEGMDLLNEKTKAEIRNLKRVCCFNLSKTSSNITYCLADFVILICCIILLFSRKEEKWEKDFHTTKCATLEIKLLELW